MYSATDRFEPTVMRWAGRAALFMLLSACGHRGEERNGEVVVFAAASTIEVITEAGKMYEEKSGINVRCSFDSSSNLARQIIAGAPADIFVSADDRWMDEVEAADGIEAGTRQDLLGNELVMVAPSGRSFNMKFAEDFDIGSAAAKLERVAVGDPEHVPAGRYARQALEALGWWAELKVKLIPCQDVRSALRLAEMGEVDAAIVYATDAKAASAVEVVATIPSRFHDPVRYPMARCSDDEEGKKFAEFLQSEDMAHVFERAGFRVMSMKASE